MDVPQFIWLLVVEDLEILPDRPTGKKDIDARYKVRNYSHLNAVVLVNGFDCSSDIPSVFIINLTYLVLNL
jgi:hypothetical protein